MDEAFNLNPCNLTVFRGSGSGQHYLRSGKFLVNGIWQRIQFYAEYDVIQDSPEVAFNITAYNSQVDKILDVRLVQPGKITIMSCLMQRKVINFQCLNQFSMFSGTKIGQASECFVYWKDPVTSDTWGLNFTSPIDAKQFRECCVSLNYYFVRIIK